MAGSLDSAIRTAQTGLNAMQSSMAVTARNVANLHTDGYSAKEAQLEGSVLSGHGAGVKMGEIQRRVDDSMLLSMRNAFSQFAKLDVKNPYFDRLSNLLGSPDSGTSVKDLMENFVTSLSDLAHDPSLAGGQSELLSNMQTFVNSLGDFSKEVQTMRADADNAVGEDISQVNDLLDNISDLNQRIVRGSFSGDVGDMEDQRDQSIDQLSQLIDITYTKDQDGNISISTKSGMTLVDSNPHHLQHLTAGSTNAGTTFDGGSIDGIYVGDRSDSTEITDDIRSGSLQGLIDLRDNILPDFQKQLDTFANSFKDTINGQSNRGTPYPGSTELDGQHNFIDGEHQKFSFSKNEDSKIVLTDDQGKETRSISIRQLMSIPYTPYGQNPGETYPPAGGWPDPLPSGGSMEDVSNRVRDWLNSKERGGAGLTGATVEWSNPRTAADHTAVPPIEAKPPSGQLNINLHTEFSKMGIIDVESSAQNAKEAKINMYFDDDGKTETPNKEVTGFSSLFGFNNIINDEKPHTQVETKAFDPSYHVSQAGVVELYTATDGLNRAAGVFTIEKGQTLDEIAETFNRNKGIQHFHAEVVRDGKLQRLHIINDNGEEVVMSDKSGAFTQELGAKVVGQDAAQSLSIRQDLLNDPSKLSTGRMTFVAGQASAGHYEIASGDGSILEDMYQDLKNNTTNYDYAGGLHVNPLSPMNYLQASVSDIVQRMSTNEQSTAVQGQVMENMQDQVNNKRQVNLDEELQNLMRYQRSYSASAKIISTIQEMFKSLEGMVR